MKPMHNNLSPAEPGGAYILHLNVNKTLTLQVGSLGNVNLPAGHYVYVGSARRSISGRMNRHKRLADSGAGKLHWHIDYLLIHPEVDLIQENAYAGFQECSIVKHVEGLKGSYAPVLHFGSSDCRSGCRAHLFRVRRHDSVKLGQG